MSQKTIILTVILFSLIVLGMFTYARLRSAELQTSLPEMKRDSSFRTVLV